MLAVCVASGALVGQYWGCSLLETLPEGPSNEALLLITVMHVVNTNLARLLNLSIRVYAQTVFRSRKTGQVRRVMFFSDL